MIFNYSYTAWYIYRGKSATTGKSTPSNTLYAVWYSNRCKTGTIIKCTIFNFSYTTWNIYRSKRRTTFENSIIPRIIEITTADRV